MQQTAQKGISALTLKLFAMTFMLMDHMWATVVTNVPWLTVIGRMAMPIFAFQIAEGFFRTHDRRRYLLRMLLFALVSEIPFNLMAGGRVFYPIHQNVMFTFLIALLLMSAMERFYAQKIRFLFVSVACAAAAWILGIVTFVDYYHYGIFMVLLFYWSYRLPRLPAMAVQLAGLLYICDSMGGLVVPVELFGVTHEVGRQMAAILALIPIWLYSGRKGYSSKAVQYACYAFYPVHMLVLYVIGIL